MNTHAYRHDGFAAKADAGGTLKATADLRDASGRYDSDVSDLRASEPAASSQRGPGHTADRRDGAVGDSSPASLHQLRSQHPELDWSDPEGALETLAILGDPEAMEGLEEAENDIATGNLLPLNRYAPPC